MGSYPLRRDGSGEGDVHKRILHVDEGVNRLFRGRAKFNASVGEAAIKLRLLRAFDFFELATLVVPFPGSIALLKTEIASLGVSLGGEIPVGLRSCTSVT
jgi:hypothetical protein